MPNKKYSKFDIESHVDLRDDIDWNPSVIHSIEDIQYMCGIISEIYHECYELKRNPRYSSEKFDYVRLFGIIGVILFLISLVITAIIIDGGNTWPGIACLLSGISILVLSIYVVARYRD